MKWIIAVGLLTALPTFGFAQPDDQTNFLARSLEVFGSPQDNANDEDEARSEKPEPSSASHPHVNSLGTSSVALGAVVAPYLRMKESEIDDLLLQKQLADQLDETTLRQYRAARKEILSNKRLLREMADVQQLRKHFADVVQLINSIQGPVPQAKLKKIEAVAFLLAESVGEKGLEVEKLMASVAARKRLVDALSIESTIADVLQNADSRVTLYQFQNIRILGSRRPHLFANFLLARTVGIQNLFRNGIGLLSPLLLGYTAWQLLDEPEYCEAEEVCVTDGPAIWKIQDNLPSEAAH